MSEKAQIKAVRKRQRQDPLDNISTLQSLASQASRRAVKEAREAGAAVTYIENGRLMQRNADKTVTELKKLDRPKLKLDEILCQTSG